MSVFDEEVSYSSSSSIKSLSKLCFCFLNFGHFCVISTSAFLGSVRSFPSQHEKCANILNKCQTSTNNTHTHIDPAMCSSLCVRHIWDEHTMEERTNRTERKTTRNFVQFTSKFSFHPENTNDAQVQLTIRQVDSESTETKLSPMDFFYFSLVVLWQRLRRKIIMSNCLPSCSDANRCICLPLHTSVLCNINQFATINGISLWIDAI